MIYCYILYTTKYNTYTYKIYNYTNTYIIHNFMQNTKVVIPSASPGRNSNARSDCS